MVIIMEEIKPLLTKHIGTSTLFADYKVKIVL